MRIAPQVVLTSEQRTGLEAYARGRRTPTRSRAKAARVETFKLSNDPRFAEKLEDLVGLYLNPPEHAIVLSLDEKSQHKYLA
jgi:hypothetical protein